MMDISPLNRPQTDTAQPATTGRAEDTTSRDDSHRFDRHLNERMDQARSEQQSSSTEKIDIKQQSDPVSPETDSVDSENEPVAKAVSSEVDSSTSQVEADDAVLLQIWLAGETSNAPQQTTDEPVGNQQILPQAGSELPLVVEDESLATEEVPVPAVAVISSAGINAPIKTADPLTDVTSAEKNTPAPNRTES